MMRLTDVIDSTGAVLVRGDAERLVHGVSTDTRSLHPEALYLALQRRRYTYTTVGETFFDATQRVRVPSQSLAQRSGNCVDATHVFASAFEALGMEPLLVFVQGHILVAVRSSSGASSAFMPTT